MRLSPARLAPADWLVSFWDGTNSPLALIGASANSGLPARARPGLVDFFILFLLFDSGDLGRLGLYVFRIIWFAAPTPAGLSLVTQYAPNWCRELPPAMTSEVQLANSVGVDWQDLQNQQTARCRLSYVFLVILFHGHLSRR